MAKQKKILIIEDEHILAAMYKDRFSHEGWNVRTVATKDGGLDAARKEQPDIILLDILLFDGHGIQFLKEKNKDKKIAKIPVVVFSNLEDLKTQKEALELGALEYLSKTEYTPQQLMEKVSSHLKK